MLFPTTIGSGVQFIRVFLDASKAFDRVEHWSLFKKLIDRNVPLVVVRLLVHWYRQQTLCVKWGRNTSSFFTVTNDVRQGGILSPFLFTINALATICDDNYMDVTPDMVSVAIGKLKCGKACGSDRLFAEHYIHADSQLAVLLSTFFTSALTHGHVPDAFMQSILVPVIKNKSGDSNDVNNYRPIALVTIASNFFEMILLDVMESFIVTCDNQFGFKKKHSTGHCIYALKNVISYYNWFGSPVYTCFFRCVEGFRQS